MTHALFPSPAGPAVMRIWGWTAIGATVGVSPTTAKRWARQDASFAVLVHRFKTRVFASEGDLLRWMRSQER